jgi:hypothetical protein
MRGADKGKMTRFRLKQNLPLSEVVRKRHSEARSDRRIRTPERKERMLRGVYPEHSVRAQHDNLLFSDGIGNSFSIFPKEMLKYKFVLHDFPLVFTFEF